MPVDLDRLSSLCSLLFSRRSALLVFCRLSSLVSLLSSLGSLLSALCSLLWQVARSSDHSDREGLRAAC